MRILVTGTNDGVRSTPNVATR